MSPWHLTRSRYESLPGIHPGRRSENPTCYSDKSMKAMRFYLYNNRMRLPWLNGVFSPAMRHSLPLTGRAGPSTVHSTDPCVSGLPLNPNDYMPSKVNNTAAGKPQHLSPLASCTSHLRLVRQESRVFVAHLSLPYNMTRKHKPKSVACPIYLKTGRARFMIMNSSMRILIL